jgi:hypothetical protein
LTGQNWLDTRSETIADDETMMASANQSEWNTMMMRGDWRDQQMNKAYRDNVMQRAQNNLLVHMARASRREQLKIRFRIRVRIREIPYMIVKKNVIQTVN